MITIEQLKETEERKNALNRYLDIESKKIQVEEEELRTHVPDFWNDQKKAEAQMRKIKEIRFWIEGYTEVEKAVEELQLAFEFVKEGVIMADGHFSNGAFGKLTVEDGKYVWTLI